MTIPPLRRAAFSALLFAAVLAVLAAMLAQRSDCQARGGHYVRGLFWFECVK